MCNEQSWYLVKTKDNEVKTIFPILANNNKQLRVYGSY